MKTNDLRVIKTRNALYNALIELMKEKTFEEIKVSDICDKALINRSTFYSHFEDKYQLLSSLIDELKNSLIEELKKKKNINNIKDYYIEVIKIFLSHVENKRETYLAIAINNRNSILIDIITDVIDSDIISHLNKDKNISKTKVPDNIISKFFVGAMVNVGIYWIYNTNKYSKEEMLNYLIELIPNELH